MSTRDDKLILDACCGSRMFWFDKEHEDTVFMDIRELVTELNDSTAKTGKRKLEIKPNVVADFTDMPFEDGAFKIVVLDPPHFESLGENSWMALKYGVLKGNWRKMLSDGFKEAFRVLEDYGILIFKWNEREVKVSEVLALTPNKPLVGHTTGRQSQTMWFVFMKYPNPTLITQ